MWRPRVLWVLVPAWLGAMALAELQPAARSACCYFSARDKDIRQPGQKVFITWNPEKQTESFTVQPRFEGNARDFGMVIPTPSKPKLDEMPRDFFKELAVFTILKNRTFPQSQLLWAGMGGMGGLGGGGMMGLAGMGGMGGFGGMPPPPRKPTVQVVETGVVGSLDYKIMTAGRADDLYTWLKDHDYKYSGDEATLDFYVKKKWYFTVMKIDTMQMKKNKDGSFTGDVTPTRFQFSSEKLIYPLKITQLSVKDKTEALFYVQAPYKTDLPGDFTYQYQWVPLLQGARGNVFKNAFGGGGFGGFGGFGGGGGGGPAPLPGKGGQWLKAIDDQIPALLKRGEELGYGFTKGVRPEANEKGHTPTTLEWARRLKLEDVKLLVGEVPYGDKVPNVDEGFTADDMKNPKRAPIVAWVIQARLARLGKERPNGYLVREAPAEDVRQLRVLAGHLREGQFLTKFRKVFTKDEMDEDLVIVPAKLGQAEDKSEYEEILPTSPP